MYFTANTYVQNNTLLRLNMQKYILEFAHILRLYVQLTQKMVCKR